MQTMDTADKKISIITPVFNGERTLTDTIESVLNQTHPNWEHILVDDCSTDQSVELIKRLTRGDHRFKVIALQANSGPSVARNTAIKAATGDYIAFLDADDVWLPTKLSEQLAFMIENNFSISHHAYRHMSYDTKTVSNLLRGPEIVDWRTFHQRRGIGYCLTFMTRNIPGLVPIFREDRKIKIAEDFTPFANILRHSNSHLLDRDLGRYRVSRNSRSRNKLRAAVEVWRAYYIEEKIPLPLALWFWVNYVLSSLIVHHRARIR
ncbi:MAG: glycosyltransferase family 2 protein [Magnetococcales bacterium]|nr:glycosyltransferase family 2 protein [Magnetococcales bacterium]